MSNELSDSIIKFMEDLELRFDCSKVMEWRMQIFPEGISDKDWAEYCFSSESPF